MKSRTTIIMAIVAAALVAYFIAVERGRPTSTERREQSFLVFGGRNFAAGGLADRKTLSQLVSRLSLQRDGRAIALEKQDGVWRVVEPIAVDADPGEVSRILFELETLRRVQSIPAGAAPASAARYGLDRPGLEVTLSLRTPRAKVREYALLIGRRTPARKTVYVRRPDLDRIDVVNDKILATLDRDLNDLRSKVVLPLDPDAVDRVSLTYPDGGSIVLQRHDDQWRLTAPIADLAESTEVDDLLARLAGLRLSAGDFVSDGIGTPSGAGLDSPRLRLVLGSDGTDTGLVIGAPSPDDPAKVYAQRLGQNTVFLLKKSDVARLARKSGDLHAGKALCFRQGDVRRITVETPNGLVALVREEHTWRLEAPRTGNADDASVEAFLDELAAIDILAWENPDNLDACGLSPPLAKIRLSTGLTERVLHVGRLVHNTSNVCARRGDFGPVLVVGGRFLRRVMRVHLDFLPREIITFKRDSLQSVSVVRPAGAVTLRREPTGWFIEKPLRVPADRTEVSDLQWALSSIKAADFVAGMTHDLAALGLDPPQMSVRLKYAEPAAGDAALATKTLLIGRLEKASGGQRYALLEGGEQVFLIAKALPRLLEQKFVSRDVCRFDAVKARSLTLEYPGRRVRFDRDGQRWLMVEPERRPAPRKAIIDLLAAASQLRAREALGYAIEDPTRYGFDRPALVLTVRLDDPGDDVRKITIGKLHDEVYFATSSSLPLPYTVAARDVARLMIARPKDGESPSGETGETKP